MPAGARGAKGTAACGASGMRRDAAWRGARPPDAPPCSGAARRDDVQCGAPRCTSPHDATEGVPLSSPGHARDAESAPRGGSAFAPLPAGLPYQQRIADLEAQLATQAGAPPECQRDRRHCLSARASALPPHPHPSWLRPRPQAGRIQSVGQAWSKNCLRCIEQVPSPSLSPSLPLSVLPSPPISPPLPLSPNSPSFHHHGLQTLQPAPRLQSATPRDLCKVPEERLFAERDAAAQRELDIERSKLEAGCTHGTKERRGNGEGEGLRCA